jgi:hypothetical protein
MFEPIDKDCDKEKLEKSCQECPMFIECIEVNDAF